MYFVIDAEGFTLMNDESEPIRYNTEAEAIAAANAEALQHPGDPVYVCVSVLEAIAPVGKVTSKRVAS
jgi:hypothetical protein